MIRKFNDHKFAQCYIREYDNGNKTLVSYTTPVIYIKNGWLEITGLYSRTTIRHIGWFMRELGLTYQFAKQLYTDGYHYNLETGEVASVA